MKIILFSKRCIDSSPLIPQCLFHMSCSQVRYTPSDTTHLISKLVNELREFVLPLNFIFLVSTHYSTYRLSLRLHFLIQHIYNIYTPSQYPFCIISKSCIHKLTSIKSQIETCNLPTLVIQLSSPPDYNLLQRFPSQGGLHNHLEIVLITGSDPGPSQSELLRMRFRNVHADITPLESPVISQVYLPLIWSTFF